MAASSGVEVSKCKQCKTGVPKGVGGDEPGKVKLKCQNCGITTGEHDTLGQAIQQWESMNESAKTA